MKGLAITWGAAALAIVLAAVCWRNVRQTRDVLGIPWFVMRRMLVFTLHTPKGFTLYAFHMGLILAYLLVSVSGVLSGEWLVSLGACVLALTARRIFIDLRPPAVVLLTTSTPGSGRIFSSMRRSISPLRCVALLDYRRLGLLHLLPSLNDNLRTRNARIWKSIVHQLIEIAPIVVVDARPESGPVVDEAFLIVANRERNPPKPTTFPPQNAPPACH